MDYFFKQKKVKRSRLRFEGFKGFTADGFFHLNRSLMSSIVGALVRRPTIESCLMMLTNPSHFTIA